MAKFNYYDIGSAQGKLAAEGLTDTQVMSDLLLESSYLTALADSTSLTAAERCEPPVKKMVATFFNAFNTSFLNAIRERQKNLTEQAKPIFWGTKEFKTAAFESRDTRLWTLVSVMDDIKSGQKEIIQQCESLIRDATRTMERVSAQLDTQVVNDKLYPVYDENLGTMGLRADLAVAKLRQLQECTRTMIGFVGMRLPSREELVVAGLIKEEKEGGK